MKYLTAPIHLTVLLSLLFLTGCGQATASTSTATPEMPSYIATFEQADCAFEIPEGFQPKCGYLIVPENRADPSGRMIRLHVAIFASTDANPAPDPVIHLVGGPGGSALDAAQFILKRGGEDILKRRDYILFDQRGTKFSDPYLFCLPYDEYLWDGQLLRNKYTYKGKKELLTQRHDGLAQVTRESGIGFSNGMAFERCNLLVVEAVNKDPNYIYGKRIWYLDPETYYIMHTEIYDQQGRFWKLFMNSTQPIKSTTGVMKPVIVGTHFYDAQRIHSGVANSQIITQPIVSDTAVTADWFTTSFLQKTY